MTTCLCCIAAMGARADLVDDVRCQEIGFSKAAEERDLSAFRSFIDADARFVGSSVLRGVDAVAEGWSVFFKADGPTIKWRPQFVEVLDDGKLALSRGPYRLVSTDPDGNVVESWGTFNSTWRLNEDGQWRVVFDAGSSASGEPDDATRALLDQEDDCP
ncbi:MAG: nuclear transport factor 2 family protein [Gammaproteobacteria bacterium]|nr:nuclear transport factor 2 family protein [Gammaproteobacteria bacterium]